MKNQQIENLVTAAKEAMKTAYAPYSKYRVGAAVLASSGKVYTGCNVENASYGLTVCAERVAIFSAAAAGERRINALAVATESMEAGNCCGACLQVMAEFSDPDNPMQIINSGKEHYRILTLDQLLPYPFRLIP